MQNCEVKEVNLENIKKTSFGIKIDFKDRQYVKNTIEDLEEWETSFDSSGLLRKKLIEIFKQK